MLSIKIKQLMSMLPDKKLCLTLILVYLVWHFRSILIVALV